MCEDNTHTHNIHTLLLVLICLFLQCTTYPSITLTSSMTQFLFTNCNTPEKYELWSGIVNTHYMALGRRWGNMCKCNINLFHVCYILKGYNFPVKINISISLDKLSAINMNIMNSLPNY